MTYMDEWEYNLWLSIHRNELTELLAVEQTASGEADGSTRSAASITGIDSEKREV